VGATTDPQPGGLVDLVPRGCERAYVQLGDSHPEQQVQLQVLYGASQRAFENKTRESLRITVQCVLRGVLRDPRLADSPPNPHVAEYLDLEITGIRARLGQDRAVAVSRGLNLGLGLGALISMFLLSVPLLWGVRLLHAVSGVTLNCTSRWSLMGAFVCGGVGAFGAVLSVLVRLRNSGDELTRRRTNGHEGFVAPAQMSRSMRHEGIYRVFVGWVLALAVYFLLTAGFVTVIDVPATPADICPAGGRPGSAVKGTDFWGFWCAVGFVAGFNERWAYGLLGRDATTKVNKAS
jgi:hypothetical protein